LGWLSWSSLHTRAWCSNRRSNRGAIFGLLLSLPHNQTIGAGKSKISSRNRLSPSETGFWGREQIYSCWNSASHGPFCSQNALQHHYRPERGLVEQNSTASRAGFPGSKGDGERWWGSKCGWSCNDWRSPTSTGKREYSVQVPLGNWCTVSVWWRLLSGWLFPEKVDTKDPNYYLSMHQVGHYTHFGRCMIAALTILRMQRWCQRQVIWVTSARELVGLGEGWRGFREIPRDMMISPIDSCLLKLGEESWGIGLQPWPIDWPLTSFVCNSIRAYCVTVSRRGRLFQAHARVV